MPEAPVQVRPVALDAQDGQAQDCYVLQHPQGTVFHRPHWLRAVAAAYGHAPASLGAWRGEQLCGLLPLMEVKSLFVGKVLVSVPYATYGGIVADDDATVAALAAEAQNLLGRRGANYLELRHREQRPLDLPVITRYDTFRKELPPAGEVLEKLPRKARAAARNGLSVLGEDCARMGGDLLGDVYRLYCLTLRRLGSPNYSWRLFRELAREYGDDCVCLAVFRGGRAIAGVVSFIFRDEMVPYFSGSTDAGQRLNANNVMYLRLMEYAATHWLKWFDFNRTRRDNRGPYDFKRHQGFEPSPLHYQICLAEGAAAPNLTPSNRKFAIAGRVWRRLPLALTRPAGSVLSRWIP